MANREETCSCEPSVESMEEFEVGEGGAYEIRYYFSYSI